MTSRVVYQVEVISIFAMSIVIVVQAIHLAWICVWESDDLCANHPTYSEAQTSEIADDEETCS